MSDQSSSNSSYDSTLTTGHARGQPDDKAASSDQTTAEACSNSAPAPQRSVASTFVRRLSSEQDPRSTAAANGPQTPSAAEDPQPSSTTCSPGAYAATQTQTQQQQQQQSTAKPHTSRLSHCREAVAQERLRRQNIKAEQALQKSARASTAEDAASNTSQPLQQQSQPQLQQSISLRLSRHREAQQHQPQQQQPQPQQQQPLQQPQKTSATRPHTSATVYLPVTKASLSELDVTKIIHNPKLRHDINFDPELHFRPNMEGDKGRRKKEKAQQFWDRLRDELTQFITNREEFLQIHGPTDDWSLPALLTAVKDIIQTLVPTRDRDVLNEGLNVPLLMQQFARRVADLEKLAVWLSSVLKMHCAPMRDEWVDEMYSELSRGNRDNNIDELVKGLNSLLGVLEAMKLDVANHQIRCLRPLLIEDTVHFEQRFFYKKLQNKRMSVEAAGLWYEHAKAESRTLDVRQRQALGEMSAFFGGLVNLLLPSVDAGQVPNTFLFDEERILKLRADMFDAIHLEICMRVYEFAARWTSSSEFDFNTPPLSAASSRASSVALSHSDSASSSPRSSGHFSGSNSGLLPVHDPEDLAAADVRMQNLYQRLVILLQSVPATPVPADRWEDMWGNMAVEICNALGDLDRADQVEELLRRCVDPASVMKVDVERMFKTKLLSALASRVKDYKTMPNVGLYVVGAGGRIHPQSTRNWPDNATSAATGAAIVAAAAAAEILAAQKNRVADARKDGCVEDMATRLAHLGILHWRVWCNLVYEPAPELPAHAPMPLL